MTPESKRKYGWLALAVAAVGAYEGYSGTAYLDVVDVPTICYGETRDVHLGQQKSRSECDELFSKRLVEFNDGVNSCVKVPLPDKRRVAMVSLAYNIGVHAFCGSTVVRRINAGDVVGACDAMRRWNQAGGKVVPGLTKRRAKERDLCLAG